MTFVRFIWKNLRLLRRRKAIVLNLEKQYGMLIFMNQSDGLWLSISN